MKEKYIIRDFHPLVFFYLFGFFMFTISFVFGVRMVSLWLYQGGMPELSFLTVLFTFSVGFNSIGFAMWFDYEANKRLFGTERKS